MTHRQLKLIDDRMYLINKIWEYHSIDSEHTEEILSKYNFKDEKQIAELLSYLPDAILETIVTELEGDDGR